MQLALQLLRYLTFQLHLSSQITEKGHERLFLFRGPTDVPRLFCLLSHSFTLSLFHSFTRHVSFLVCVCFWFWSVITHPYVCVCDIHRFVPAPCTSADERRGCTPHPHPRPRLQPLQDLNSQLSPSSSLFWLFQSLRFLSRKGGLLFPSPSPGVFSAKYQWTKIHFWGRVTHSGVWWQRLYFTKIFNTIIMAFKWAVIYTISRLYTCIGLA